MSHLPGVTIKPLVKLPKDPNACWAWLGAVDKLGTARKQFHGESWIARRWMWQMLFGPIPEGCVVTTTCGDKACTNPHHLRMCSQAEANRDSVQTLLLPAEVSEIRAARKDRGPNTARVLADRYGCHPNTIRDIWARRSWGRARPNHGPRNAGSPAPEAADDSHP